MGVGCQTRSWQDLYHNHNYLTKPLNQKIHIQKYKKYKKITAHNQKTEHKRRKKKQRKACLRKIQITEEKRTKTKEKKTIFDKNIMIKNIILISTLKAAIIQYKKRTKEKQPTEKKTVFDTSIIPTKMKVFFFTKTSKS